MAVLTFHHIDPKIKSFNLDLNNIATKSLQDVLEESKNAIYFVKIVIKNYITPNLI